VGFLGGAKSSKFNHGFDFDNLFLSFIICLFLKFVLECHSIKQELLFLYAGSFSRSAVNNEGGAKTGLSGVVAGIIMGCSLLFLTPLFEYIPQVCFYVPAVTFVLQ